MVLPATGDVVLFPFPYSDLSQTKIRPAICLADAGKGDWVCCQVTSNPYGDALAVEIKSGDFVQGGLRLDSFARPGKLFTVHRSLFARTVGTLNDAARARLLKAVVNLLTGSTGP